MRSKKAKRVCASRKKLKKPKSMATSSTSSGSEVQTVTYTFSGSRLVELHSLDEFISERCICSNCTLTLEEYFSQKEGFCTGLAVYCANCKMTSNIEYSRSPGKFLELNRKAVFAMRLLGQGRSALETFCAVLELPSPLAKLSFQSHVSALHVAAMAVAKESMHRAAQEVHTAVDPQADEDTLIDVCVSGDGTWHRRGFSSLNGVAIVIAHDTGKVLDYEVMSKYCYSCQYWEKQPTNSDAFQVWKATHKCDANFEGSAPAMESSGMVEMFSRSIAKYKLRYTHLISDGDSKSFAQVRESNPYGDVSVEKISCVGHVQKLMGTRLRALKKSHGAKKLSDGKTIGGRGRLTDTLIDDMQTYYGQAIRTNVGDVDAMHNAVMAILYHLASSDEKPLHQYCPKGDNSWCKWQKDKANCTNTYRHKHTLPPVIVDLLKPVFDDLSSKSRLQKCLQGYTQNANESLHSTIWKYCPKENFVGRTVVETAVCLAIGIFNDGMEYTIPAILETAEVTSIGQTCREFFAQKDQLRLEKADSKFSDEGKQARKRARRIRKGYEQKIQVEGDTYVSGGFD